MNSIVVFFCDDERNRVPPKNKYIDFILNQFERKGNVVIAEKLSNFACLHIAGKKINANEVQKTQNVIETIMVKEISAEKEILKKYAEKWGAKLNDKTFVVRVSRKGNHRYTSVELEKELGSIIWKVAKCDVDLKKPQKTYRVFIENRRAFVSV